MAFLAKVLETGTLQNYIYGNCTSIYSQWIHKPTTGRLLHPLSNAVKEITSTSSLSMFMVVEVSPVPFVTPCSALLSGAGAAAEEGSGLIQGSGSFHSFANGERSQGIVSRFGSKWFCKGRALDWIINLGFWDSAKQTQS